MADLDKEESTRGRWIHFLGLDSHPLARAALTDAVWAQSSQDRHRPTPTSSTLAPSSVSESLGTTAADGLTPSRRLDHIGTQSSHEEEAWQVATGGRRRQRRRAGQVGPEENNVSSTTASSTASDRGETDDGPGVEARKLPIAEHSLTSRRPDRPLETRGSFAILQQIGDKEIDEVEIEWSEDAAAARQRRGEVRSDVPNGRKNARGGGTLDAHAPFSTAPTRNGSGTRPGDAWSEPDDLTPHADEAQVDLDVRRSFVGDAWVDWQEFKLQEPAREADDDGGGGGGESPRGADETDVATSAPPSGRQEYVARQRKVRMAQLADVVKAVLRRRPQLSYYQGYHDVVSTMLLVLAPGPFPPLHPSGSDIAVTSEVAAEAIWPNEATRRLCVLAAERVSLHWLRDAMMPTLEPALGWLKLTRLLIRQEDPFMARLVERPAPLPYFMLSWQISFFAHDVAKSSAMTALFAHVLQRGPGGAIFLSAALVLEAKGQLSTELLGFQPDDEGRTRNRFDGSLSLPDPAETHQALAALPSWIDEGRLDTDAVIRRAEKLEAKYASLDPLKPRYGRHDGKAEANDTALPDLGEDGMGATDSLAPSSAPPHRLETVMGDGSVLHTFPKLSPVDAARAPAERGATARSGAARRRARARQRRRRRRRVAAASSVPTGSDRDGDDVDDHDDDTDDNDDNEIAAEAVSTGVQPAQEDDTPDLPPAHQRGGVAGNVAPEDVWASRDAEAVEVLRRARNDVKTVVRDASVEPASDDDEGKEEKGARRAQRRRRDAARPYPGGPTTTALLVVGGLVGAGAVLLYSAGRGELNLSSVRSLACLTTGSC